MALKKIYDIGAKVGSTERKTKKARDRETERERYRYRERKREREIQIQGKKEGERSPKFRLEVFWAIKRTSIQHCSEDTQKEC
jgi:hypothetical protein